MKNISDIYDLCRSSAAVFLLDVDVTRWHCKYKMHDNKQLVIESYSYNLDGADSRALVLTLDRVCMSLVYSEDLSDDQHTLAIDFIQDNWALRVKHTGT